MRGRKVYLDYRTNPFGAEPSYEDLQPEAYEYLKNAGACFGTPIDRLLHMNAPAYELYLGKGVDLKKEMLPIALCAQHNNGGISVDLWWQTSVPGLFACGECAGTHGISRPGGSALNAGQVGALRAAQYICQKGRSLLDEAAFSVLAEAAVQDNTITATGNGAEEKLFNCRRRMSDLGGAIREESNLRHALTAVKEDLSQCNAVGGDALTVYRYRDALICQQVLLEAMLNYASTLGTTRGSALYQHPAGQCRQGLEACFGFISEPKVGAQQVQEGVLTENGCQFTWRPVRPLPKNDDFFETVWRGYRKNKNVY